MTPSPFSYRRPRDRIHTDPRRRRPSRRGGRRAPGPSARPPRRGRRRPPPGARGSAAPVAGFLVEGSRSPEIPRHAFPELMARCQEHATDGVPRGAAPRIEGRGPGEVLRGTVPVVVQVPEIGAGGNVTGVAGLLVQRDRARDVPRYTGPCQLPLVAVAELIPDRENGAGGVVPAVAGLLVPRCCLHQVGGTTGGDDLVGGVAAHQGRRDRERGQRLHGLPQVLQDLARGVGPRPSGDAAAGWAPAPQRYRPATGAR